MEQREFEGLIRKSLESQAELISPSPGYTQTIKAQLRLQQAHAGKFDALRGYALHQSFWRRCATAACCVMIILALVFTISTPARIWATDTFMKVFKISKISGGYQVTPTDPSTTGAITIQGRSTGTVPIPVTPAGTSVSVVVTTNKEAPKGTLFSTPEDLRDKVGLAFYLPSYVPDGYALSSMFGDEQALRGQSKNFGVYKIANAIFTGEGKNRLMMYVTDHKEFMYAAEGAQNVSILDLSGQWSDYPVLSYDQNSQSATVGHQLRWVKNGTTYVLTNDSADLSMAEMVKIAESIDIK